MKHIKHFLYSFIAFITHLKVTNIKHTYIAGMALTNITISLADSTATANNESSVCYYKEQTTSQEYMECGDVGQVVQIQAYQSALDMDNMEVIAWQYNVW